MKQAFYFLSVAVPTEEDFEFLGPGLKPIVEVQLELREEFPTGMIHTGIYKLPLLYEQEEEEEYWC